MSSTATTTSSSFDAYEYDKGDFVDTGIGGKRIVSKKPGAFSGIPIIDLSNATHPELAKRKELAKEIYDACTNVGFFYIKNHGVPQELVTGAFTETKRFFHDLTTEQKMELDISNNKEFYGYAPIRTQIQEGQVRKRMFESINFGYEPQFDPDAVDMVDNGPSFWPKEDDLPKFKDNIGAYYSAVMSLSRRLLRLFALGLDLDENFFDQFCKHPGVLLKLNHYPPSVPNTEAEAGIGAHSDLESFTILAQDDVKSLEVLSTDGTWINADPIPGTFVVNIGDAMSMWTNDLFLSTIHRAYNKEGKARYSIPFFFGADYDAIMETLPSCISETRPLKYEPISAGEHVRMKLARTYPKTASTPSTPISA
jgi:isopenicillin N synthase-like dioxygenase